MVIDTHCHLNDDIFKEKIDSIVDSMPQNNLQSIVVASYDFASTKRAFSLAQKYKSLYALIGMHPHDSKTYSTEMEEYMKECANNSKVVGVGEIGLDYYYDLSDRQTQQIVFERQIQLADELKLPIVIHTRDAWQDTLDILNKNKQYINSGILFHCFTGSLEIMRELKKFDAYFAFGGTITFKNANKIFDVIRACPKDRMVVETDSPYLTPVPFRGTTNTPDKVNLVVDKLVEVLGMERVELEKILEENTKRLFKKMV